jgi:L-asparaginase
MAEKQKIHFILTGGTIDSYYESRLDTVVPNKKSVIPRFIDSLKLYSLTKFSEVCMKDSRNLTKDDLKNILKTIEKSDCERIIITHGTYTIGDTARYIKANLKRNDQTVVLTGSMTPLQGFSPSDAPFNLGYSLAKVEELSPGAYICINGKVFSPEEIMKSINEGRFSSIFEQK